MMKENRASPLPKLSNGRLPFIPGFVCQQPARTRIVMVRSIDFTFTIWGRWYFQTARIKKSQSKNKQIRKKRGKTLWK